MQDQYHPDKLVLISGYRSPELNDNLRGAGSGVAKASLHTEGLAADLQFVGVNLPNLWERLRKLRIGGIGLYEQQGFLHLDTGRPRFWEPSTSRIDENLSAGNARVFVRTDFDRYQRLPGAHIRLHQVTALPVRIARQVLAGTKTVMIEPVTEGMTIAGDCYVIARPAERYEFRILTSDETPSAGPRLAIRLSTCTPRVGQTPADIESNVIELTTNNQTPGTGLKR